MTSKARMTFRFEPQPVPKPVKAAHTEQPPAKLAVVPKLDELEGKPPETGDTVIESYPPMNGPYVDDDIRALEEMIRRTDSVVVHIPKKSAQTPSHPQGNQLSPPVLDWKLPETAMRKPAIVHELEQIETDHEQPERWSLPEEVDGAYRPTSEWLSRAGTYVPPSSPSWTRVILSVAAAIVTGALFGYMVLTLFTGEPMIPGKSQPVPTAGNVQPSTAADTPVTTIPEKSEARPSSTQSGSTAPVTSIAELPADDAYILQYGVFRSLDSAKLAAAQLQDVGLPAAIDDSDGFRVYAGIAASKAEAELLAGQMPNIEVYVKPTSIQSLKLITNEHTEAITSFLKRSETLGRLISQITVTGLLDDLPQPISADDAEALQQAAAAWQQARTAADEWSAEANVPVTTLIQPMETALAALNSYSEKPSRFQLWKAQTAILEARLADAELRQALQSAPGG